VSRLLQLAIFVWLASGLAGSAHAQEASATPAAAADGEALIPSSTGDLALLVTRVEAAALDTVRHSEAMATLDDRLAVLDRESELLAAFEEHLSTEAEDVFFHGRIATIEDRLAAQRGRLEALMQGVASDLERLSAHRKRWVELESAWSRQALGQVMSPEAQRDLASEIRRIRASIKTTSKTLRKAEDALVAFQSGTLDVQTRARNLSQTVDLRRSSSRSNWRTQTSAPLWAHARDEDETGVSWARLLEVDRRFLVRARDTLILHVLLVVLLFVVSRRIVRAPGVIPAVALLRHPITFALFVTTLVFGPSYQPSPPVVDALRWTIVAVTGARLAAVAFSPLGLRGVGIALIVGEPTIRLVESLGFSTLTLRFVVVTTAIGAAALLFLHRSRLRQRDRFWWRTGLGLGALLLFMAALAETLGFSALGRSMFGATLDTGFYAVVFIIGRTLARSLAQGLGSMVVPLVSARWRELVEHWARSLGWATQAALLVLIALQVSFAWQVTAPPEETWRALTVASITMFGMKISIAKVALAAVTLYLARQIIRVVELSLDSTLSRRPGIDAGTGDSIKTIVRYVLLALAVVLFLAMLGIELQSVAIIAGALGIGIGFGLQSVVADFTSGLILLFEQSLRAGDSLIIDEKWGTVSRIGLRATVITLVDQSELVVPNSLLTSEKLQNWTLSTKQARVFCQVGIAYGSNVELAFRLLEKIAAEDPEVLDDPPPEVLFMEFGDSALNLELRVWLNKATLRLHARSRILRSIDAHFREHGIVIAFPQRDVHLHLADEGVAEALASTTAATPTSKSS
jgi:potassium-dependent mechanosensitive channel